MKQNLNLLFFLFFLLSGTTVLEAQINCNNSVYVSLDDNGDAIFNADMFLEGPVTWSSASVSPTSADCGDAGTTIPITVTAIVNGVTETCTSEAMIEDKLFPIPYVLTDYDLYLGANGQATLFPSMIDAGSSDNCAFSMEVSPSQFNCNHIGVNVVTFTVTDDSGNSDFALMNVNVIGNAPSLVCNNSVIASLSIPPGGGNPTVKLFAESFLEGGPYCDASNFTIQVLDLAGNEVANGTGSVNMYTAGNYTFIVSDPWTGNSCWGSLEVVGSVVSSCGALSCNQLINAQMTGPGMDQPVTMYVDNFLEGAYTCDLTQLEIVIAYDDNLTIPIVTGIGSVEIPYSGVFFYQIREPGTNNACWGNIDILGNNPCPSATFTQPLANIDLNIVGLDVGTISQALSPENLMTLYNFTEIEVQPTWNENTCSVISWNWSDVVIDSGNGLIKIIRTFTTIDWISGEVQELVQVIKNNTESSYICDFLPRTTPVTNCLLGHVDTDDVEWPGDLMISDHRITPDDLVTISNVDVLDASPTFYNEPSSYDFDYYDVLETLTDSSIVINRIWDVERNDVSGSQWTYGQNIVIDFTQFSNLVTVNTTSSRALPGVNINGNSITDAMGQAIVDDNDPVDPSLTGLDINGLNILDIVLTRLYITGAMNFDDNQLIAADYGQSGSVSTLDIVQMINSIMEKNGAITNDWIFLDESNNVTTEIKPRAHYIAIKPGDINDDALVGNEVEDLVEISASFEDQILNKGQEYTIDINLENPMDVLGVQMIMDFNTDNLTLIQVDGIDAFWNTTADGRIIMVEGAASLGTDTAIRLLLRAKENVILSQNLNFNTARSSYLVDENLELLKITGNVENVITTSIHDIEDQLTEIRVYPNPASNSITLDRGNFSASNNLKFTLLDASGRRVLSQDNPSTIILSELKSGMYLYQIRFDDQVQYGKLSVIK